MRHSPHTRKPSPSHDQWRIERIAWESRERDWLSRLNISILVGVGLLTLAFSAFLIARINIVGLFALGGLATMIILSAQRMGKRPRQNWTLIEAHCLDREIRAFERESGETIWQVRVLCEYLHDGQLWRATPETTHYHFKTEDAAQAFLGEHIGDDNEMTLYLDPRNPLHTML